MAVRVVERTPAQKKLDEKILKRVKRGLKWLEETHGPGWEDHIDMKTLDLSSGSRCVLGQVFYEEGEREYASDGFSYAMEKFSLGDHGNDEFLGFSIVDEDWDDLQEVWERVLTPIITREEVR